MIRISAQPVTTGVVKAQAVVTTMQISFTGGMDPDTGIIREPGHELYGQSVAGKILVFPSGKGSTTGSWQFYAAFKRHTAPVGIINQQAEGVVAVSAIITNTPMVHGLEPGMIEKIRTGDIIKLDADNGMIEVFQEPQP